MFLKLNTSMILNNLTDVVESPIWSTLIPSLPQLPDDIDDYNDNENKEDDDEEDGDLSPVPVESDEPDYTCEF